MKVICIKNDDLWLNHELTMGKEYEYSSEFEFTGTKYILVRTDDGKMRSCPMEIFITLEEYRDKKLEELGI
jgi:hypothetical protein